MPHKDVLHPRVKLRQRLKNSQNKSLTQTAKKNPAPLVRHRLFSGNYPAWRQCQWIFGDDKPMSANPRCLAPSLHDSTSYCAEHHPRVWIKVSSKSKRKANRDWSLGGQSGSGHINRHKQPTF